MPPSTLQASTSGTATIFGSTMPLVVSHSATPPPLSTPSRNWPSAPMFQTLER